MRKFVNNLMVKNLLVCCEPKIINEEKIFLLCSRKIMDKELTSDEENILEKNLVWIYGSARSGTTWLGTELLRYKDNIIWTEPYIGVHLMLLKRHIKRDDYFFSNNFKKVWIPLVKKLILNRAYALAKSVNNLVIIKDPNGIAGANTVMECLPNSKLIFLSRDGRDVIDSLIDSHKKDSWNKGLKPFKTDQERYQQIMKYSDGWVRGMILMLKTFEKHSPDLRILVKYEDLLNDTFNELKKIYNLLKIEITDKELKKIIEKYDFSKIPEKKKGSGKFWRSAQPGKWKENFSNKEQKNMNQIMKDSLVKLGYS